MFGSPDSFAHSDLPGVPADGPGPSRWWARPARAALVLMLATAAAACGGHDAGPVVAVGAGDSPESVVIAEIYAGALARTGLHTTVRSRPGGREDLFAALDANAVALFGDVNGDLLTALDSTSAATTPTAVGSALYRSLPDGVTVSDAADGTDLRPTVVAAAARPADFPASLQDLSARCPELAVGVTTGPPLDALRAPLDPDRDVRAPLHTVYHCDPARIVAYPSETELRKALSDGEIHLAVLSGPPALLADGGADLAPLADPGYAFRAANVLAVLRKSALTDRQLRKLNYVAGELTTTELADMVHDVRDSGAIPADLARDWLDTHGL